MKQHIELVCRVAGSIEERRVPTIVYQRVAKTIFAPKEAGRPPSRRGNPATGTRRDNSLKSINEMKGDK